MKRSNEGQNDEHAETRSHGETWSRSDFEAALPLYVGGDLDPADAAFVDAWITRHPADRALLDAAQAARDVLKDHGERAHALRTPDLWPAVRAELARAGAFEKSASISGAPSHTSTPERSIPASEHGRRAPGDGRVLGGARWFQRRGVAAAAAVLLAATVGLLLVDSGSQVDGPGGTGSTGAKIAAEAPAQPVFTGSPASVRLVGTTDRARGGSPLRRPGGAATHLIDEAPLVPFWQGTTGIQTIEVQRTSAELVGGNR